MSTTTTRVDLHVKVLDERVVACAKARGLDVLVYAPHYTRLATIRARARAYSDPDLLVVPAREVFTGTWRTRRHLLAVGLDRPVPDFITFAGALDELEAQGAAVLVPHPEFLTMSCTEDDVARHRDRIDAVETYNPKHRAHHNRRARTIAARTGLPAFGSSYAHLRRTVGEVWTAFAQPIHDAASLVNALERGVPRRVRHRRGPTHELRRAAEFAHLGYENTWEKVERAAAPGPVATHPEQPAYGGQFDDVRADCS